CRVSVMSLIILLDYVFFFSSRRRHTRCYRDWSSDVCSSDLRQQNRADHGDDEQQIERAFDGEAARTGRSRCGRPPIFAIEPGVRSEERRVGKEGRCGWAAKQAKKEMKKERGLRENGATDELR